MTKSECYEVNRWFFDLDFVRNEYPEADTLSDKAIVRKILDPHNTSPHDPNPLFQCEFYRRVIDESDKQQNPVLHFLAEGVNQGISPNHCFDTLYYLKQNSESGLTAKGALQDALARLRRNDNLPSFHPFIDEKYILSFCDLESPLDFYYRLFRGNYFVANPHPLVDITYLSEKAETKFESFASAFDYYWNLEKDVSTHIIFDVDYYRSQLPKDDVVRRAVYHYLISDDPHSPQPLFESHYYISLVAETGAKVPERPLEHFLSCGQAAGIAPSPLFDTKYYREQTGCGLNVLQHYLEGGHLEFETHPMVCHTEARLLSNASLDPAHSIGYRLVVSPRQIPISVTPDFHPGYWKRKSHEPLPTDATRNDLRNHYLKFGYPAGKAPNTLISTSYIAQQAQLQDVVSLNHIQFYYRSSWNRRKRILVALHSFQNNPVNRKWLDILNVQTRDPSIEVVVVGQTPGPLWKEFSQVSHVWRVPKSSEAEPHVDTLHRSITLLHKILQSNMPVVSFVEADIDLQLASIFKSLTAPIVLFGEVGLLKICKENEEQVASIADLVWSQSEHEASQFQKTISETGVSFCEGYTPQAELRDETRALLGIQPETIVVVGSGMLNYESGVDIFGAIAAELFVDIPLECDVKFIWQGVGRNFHKPAFFAQYFVDIVTDPGNFHVLTDIDTKSAVAIADIYLETKRSASDYAASDDASALDIPTIVMGSHSDCNFITFDPYDIKDAVIKLKRTIDSCRLYKKSSNKVNQGVSNNREFIGSFNRCLKSVDIDIEFINPKNIPEKLLVLTNQDLWEKIRMAATRTSYVGLPSSIQVKLEKLRAIGLSSGVFDFLSQEDSYDFVFCSIENKIPDNLKGNFNRVIGILESDEVELEKACSMGHVCEKIAVGSSELITAMELFNPDIASLMTIIKNDRYELKKQLNLPQASNSQSSNIEISQDGLVSSETHIDSDIVDSAFHLRNNANVEAIKINSCSHFCLHEAAVDFGPNAKLSESYIHTALNQSSLYKIPTPNAYINSGLQDKPRLIFVSHNASRTGAPAIVLQLLKHFSQSNAFECFTILDEDGERLSEYEALSHIHVMSHSRHERTFSDQEAANEISSMFEHNGLFESNIPVCAIVNSAESARIARNIANMGVPLISLIHEIAASYPPQVFSDFGRISEKVVFPSEFVKRTAECFSGIDSSKVWVRGQGLLTEGFGSASRDACRKSLREHLGIEENSIVVLNVGTMDQRKGGDLFVDTAKLCLQQLPEGAPVYFVWYGKPQENFIYPFDIVRQNGLEKHVRFMPATSEIEQVFMGGDIFLLTARADPFPCVVHEAMACGLPVIAFHNGGGAPELIGDDCGQIVGMMNLKEMATAVLTYILDEKLRYAHAKNAIEKISNDWDFHSYQNDIYELMKTCIAAPESGWPEIAGPWTPEKLVIMRGTSVDLEAFSNQIEGDDSVWDVALIDGRFGAESEATAACLRRLGHNVRHFQPKANNQPERASIVAALLKNTSIKDVVLVNAFQYVLLSQIKCLSCSVHLIQTEEVLAEENLHSLSPYLSSIVLMDDRQMALPH